MGQEEGTDAEGKGLISARVFPPLIRCNYGARAPRWEAPEARRRLELLATAPHPPQ